ncbi:MAG: hypothetical protein FJ207_09330 [Gemmatimonadetes bacterium]|nr:hypothetical protein [Gemmatimonadota bacterium]
MTSTARHLAVISGGGAALGVALALIASGVVPRAVAAPPPAYELAPLPEDIDSITPLEAAARSVASCAAPCRGIVYAWTPRMPLSRSGIPNVVEAAGSLGVQVVLVSTEELLDYAAGHHPGAVGGIAFADEMLEVGALTHAPAIVVHSGSEIVGSAILGYKRAEAYESLLGARLAESGAVPSTALSSTRNLRSPSTSSLPTHAVRTGPAPQATIDRPAVGLPGAYFRWVPGTRKVAYESDRSIYLLDLDDGENSVAPGWIDFVPTPDGRYFVTPGPGNEGLTFFDARDVFSAAERNRSMAVEAIFTDMRMRDQYPSVGILARDQTGTRYRVLTSWFEGLLYRDYEVSVNAATGASSVRPIGEPVVPCDGYALSTPIMSQDGREVAARDERTGTTKIFAIEEEGRCTEVLDFGMGTSKVAWHASGQRVAFSTPRRGRGGAGGEGIFVFDRASGEVAAVPGSSGASRLAFPDFVGDDVVFLVPGDATGAGSFFRLVGGME